MEEIITRLSTLEQASKDQHDGIVELLVKVEKLRESVEKKDTQEVETIKEVLTTQLLAIQNDIQQMRLVRQDLHVVIDTLKNAISDIIRLVETSLNLHAPHESTPSVETLAEVNNETQQIVADVFAQRFNNVR